MLMLIAGCLLFLLMALFLIWLPFYRRDRRSVAKYRRQKVNAEIYQRQIAAIDKQFDRDEAAFGLLKNELALGILTEDIESEGDKRSKSSKPHKDSFWLPLMMTAAVIGLTVIGYTLLGNYQQVADNSKRIERNPLNGLSDSQVRDSQLIKLQDKIKANPQDSEAWFILAEYYLYNNEFNNALISLERVIAIKGESNEALAAKAMVFYYQDGQRIMPRTQRLLEIILDKEPLQVTALMLIASDSYYHGQYKEAIDIWQRLLDSESPNVNRVMLIERINVAKMMANRE